MKKKLFYITMCINILLIILIGVFAIRTIANKHTKNKTVDNETKEKYVDVLDDGTKLNKSNKLKETKIVDGFEVYDISLMDQNGLSLITATVKNTSNKETDTKDLKITFLDENNSEMGSFNSMIMPVKAGETTSLTAQVTNDYSNAYDFRVEIIEVTNQENV